MPVSRPDLLPEPPARDRSFGPVNVGDDWTVIPYQLWGATKLTLQIDTNPVQLQLARERPPAPPTWGNPILLQLGPWSHVGEFGYWRFRNATRGQVAVVSGVAYAE